MLSIIREQLHREPNDGDVFIVMSKDRRIVRLFTYDNSSLLVRETFSRQPINYSEDMSADEKDRFIQYLVEKVNMAELDKRAMELAVEEFQATFDSVSSSLASLKKEMETVKVELRDERAKRKKAEAKALQLDQQLKCAPKTAIFGHQIDNMAERTIRKLTTQRNNSLHYGSDAGVEMAVVYHSVISTVKLHGMSCWRYLGEFFTKIFKGCRDFLSLTPANIGLTYVNS